MSSTVIPLEDLEYTVGVKFSVPENKGSRYKSKKGKPSDLITAGKIIHYMGVVGPPPSGLVQSPAPYVPLSGVGGGSPPTPINDVQTYLINFR